MDAPPAKKAKADKAAPTVISLRVENPEGIDYVGSAEVIVEGFPLYLRFKKVTGGEEKFIVHMGSRASQIASSYFCDFVMDVKLINQTDAAQSLHRHISGTYDSLGDTSVGPPRFFSWEECCDPEKGFLKDGVLLLEASIWVKTSFIRKRKPIDFFSPSPIFDVAFVTEGMKLYACKKTLAAHSDVFEGMFFNGFKESKEAAEVPIPDIKWKDFLQVLNFLYRKGKGVNDSNVEGLLVVADKYNITIILDEVEKYLLQSQSINLSRKLRIAEEFRLSHLHQKFLASLDSCEKIKNLKKSSDYASLSETTKDVIFDKHIHLAETEKAEIRAQGRNNHSKKWGH